MHAALKTKWPKNGGVGLRLRHIAWFRERRRMLLRVLPARRGGVATCLDTAQIIVRAASHYMPAVLATPMVASFGFSPASVFGAFSMAPIVSAIVGPWAGAPIDQLGGRDVLMTSNLVFACCLTLLVIAPSPAVLILGGRGLGLGMGLYEAPLPRWPASMAARRAARSPASP